MKVDYTEEMVFSFDGPNLCLLGNEEDFKRLALSLLDLTIPNERHTLLLKDLDFLENVGKESQIIFSSKPDSNLLGKLDINGNLFFELDPRYWERIFKYFALMSWEKRTYYLNQNEDCLIDLQLLQECNLICSSKF